MVLAREIIKFVRKNKYFSAAVSTFYYGMRATGKVKPRKLI